MTDENVVYMDIPKLKAVAERFGTMSETLKQTSNALQAAITVLKASAFVGLFGNAALANYLEQLKPQIDRFAERCSEMVKDVEAAIAAVENQDAVGSTKFH